MVGASIARFPRLILAPRMAQARFLLVVVLGLLAAPFVHAQDALDPSLPPPSLHVDTPSPDAGGETLAPPDSPGPASSDDASGTGLSVSGERVLDVKNNLDEMPTVDLTHSAEDIWDRIRRGFTMPDLDTPEVTQQQSFYLSHPAYLKRILERSKRYLYYVVDEIERRGMPTELALLPMVESAYNPLAYSHSHASGLWQFIPSTGRNYNLAQNSWVDERRDIIASTNAALDYLQTIYEMQGDWQLALASYNWGEGAVARAVQRNEAAGRSTEYAHLRMPEETRNYVPKLQALKNIIARPELFNVILPYIANRPYFITVDGPPGLDLATAAKLADTPLEEFMALNPGYQRPVIPKGSMPIVIPADKEAIFKANLSSMPAASPHWKAYEVKRGDKIQAVAAHFGITVAELRKINNLRTNRLTPGHALLVPSGSGNLAGALKAAELIPDPPAPKVATRLIRKRVVIRDKHGKRHVVYRTVRVPARQPHRRIRRRPIHKRQVRRRTRPSHAPVRHHVIAKKKAQTKHSSTTVHATPHQ